MGEILSAFLFGTGFAVASIVLIRKDKITASAIVKYFAAYMYISLAYKTYQVVLTDYAVILFVGLVLACLGDIAIGFRDVVEKYGILFGYAGIALYIIEAGVFSYTLLSNYENWLIFMAIGALLGIALSYLLLFKNRVSTLDRITESLFLVSHMILLSLSIGLLISGVGLGTLILSAGSLLVGISSIFFVYDRHTLKDIFALTVFNLILRYLGQILITVSMAFVYYN